MGPSLVTGSRATPIPTDAVTGFASASTLLRREGSIDAVGSRSASRRPGISKRYDLQSDDAVTTQPKRREGEQAKVPAFKKPRIVHEKRPKLVQEEVPRTAAVRSAESAGTADILAHRKTRKKKHKDGNEAQTTIKKTKIIKPGAMNSGKKVVTSTKRAKDVISTAVRPPASTQEEDVRAKEEFKELCLEKAITRRKEWTPCKDTASAPTLAIDIEKSVDPKPFVDTPSANEPPISRFGNLLGSFGFSQEGGDSLITSESTRQGNGEAIVKRRKIELVNGVPAPHVLEKPKRCKSPKKKPQTVTEKATAPFAPAKATDPPSLLQYFGANTTTESIIAAKAATDAPDISMTVEGRPFVKKTAASKPAKTKSKRSVQKQPILLSPESAMKTAINQEMIFGTSSQLVREESPTIIRDLQQALKESESTVEQKQSWAKDYDFLDLPSGKSRSSGVQAIMASRSLWSAASRNIDGSLVEVETVNLADTPKPPCMVAKSATITRYSGMPEPQLQSNENVEKPHENTGVSMVPKLGLDASPVIQQLLQESETFIPRSVAEAALRDRPKSKSPVKKASAAKGAANQMPNYEGFTEVQLKKEVSSYGFKPIKSRGAMLKLLERCWQSKTSIALQEMTANVSLPQPVKETIKTDISEQCSPSKKRGRPPKSPEPIATNGTEDDNAPPKKPRGRPKKDPTATTPPKRKRKAKPALSEAIVSAADDEIYDSSPPTPSPPRRRSPPKLPDQLPLSLPLGTTTNTAHGKKNDRTRLFSQITKAVTTFPPNHDPKSLTWHEKILLYDPIVLEDLTVWLNTEGLGKIGEDDEVCPGDVKEWCEERSVCCLWRENLRGGARERW